MTPEETVHVLQIELSSTQAAIKDLTSLNIFLSEEVVRLRDLVELALLFRGTEVPCVVH